MKIQKGDKVRIMLGKDRGKEGKVEFVLVKRKKVFVGGVNLYKRHVKKHGNLEGGIIDLPKPMDISNVALICPNCNKTTKIGIKKLESGKTRICRKCKKEINTNAKD
ncbi:MAG: 50S ribosomal protein L24 [Candidatus Daviesbacteria bacterium]|nr:50S ribosomal protein L24 [Candidatus Daviesbacteria bacterium]